MELLKKQGDWDDEEENQLKTLNGQAIKLHMNRAMEMFPRQPEIAQHQLEVLVYFKFLCEYQHLLSKITAKLR